MTVKKPIIGVLVDWLESPYHQEIFRGIKDFCDNHGVLVSRVIMGAMGSPRPWENNRNQLLGFLSNQLFDGLLVFSGSLGRYVSLNDLQDSVSKMGIPAFFIDGYSDRFPYIVPDNETGFSELLKHLFVHHKYKHPIYVSGPSMNHEAKLRLKAFETACQTYGIEMHDDYIHFGDYTINHAYQFAQRWDAASLKNHDVIVCANDNMAIGVMSALSEKGIVVPSDIAVTGIDDIIFRYSDFSPLTTVNLSLYQMGYLATENLFLLLTRQKAYTVIKLPMFPVIRASCGCQSIIEKDVVNASLTSYFTESERSILVKFSEQIRNALPLNNIQILAAEWRKIIWSFIRSGRDADMLHRSLSAIRNHMIVSEERNHDLENLFHRLRNILFSEIVYKENSKMIIQEFELEKLNEFASNLVISSNLNRQSQMVKRYLMNAGIDSCVIVQVQQKGDLQIFGNITVSFGSENLDKLEGGKIGFSEFWTDAILNDFREKSWHFEILQDGNEVLGWLALSLSSSKFIIRDFITICVSALKSSRYYDQVSRHAEILEQEVSTRTQDLNQLNQKLLEEVKAKEIAEENLKIVLEELKVSNHKLRNLSHKDELTGLNNRRGFMVLAEQFFHNLKRKKIDALVFFIDLDGLKIINDQFGHGEGDFSIIAVSEILKTCFREGDILARIGGDEFTVLSLFSQNENLDTIIARLNKTVEDFNNKSNKPFLISISVGSALLNEDSEDIESVLEEADASQYIQKRNKIKKIYR